MSSESSLGFSSLLPPPTSVIYCLSSAFVQIFSTLSLSGAAPLSPNPTPIKATTVDQCPGSNIEPKYKKKKIIVINCQERQKNFFKPYGFVQITNVVVNIFISQLVMSTVWTIQLKLYADDLYIFEMMYKCINNEISAQGFTLNV